MRDASTVRLASSSVACTHLGPGGIAGLASLQACGAPRRILVGHQPDEFGRGESLLSASRKVDPMDVSRG